MTCYCERPSLILLVGLPGSGKSTWANDYKMIHKDTVIMSSDSIREELYGDESIQGNADEVFRLMQDRTVESLTNGINVIYDATNITRKSRASIINACPKFVRIQCFIIWEDLDTCINRDANRDRTVGKDVIYRMVKRFQSPYYDEGIDEIYINNNNYKNYTKTYLEDMKIPHDNPHHTYDIYNHCVSAKNYLIDKGVNKESLLLAALYHDCGKPFTKDFHNKQGELSEYAHYYQHQCVGAYMSYGMDFTSPYVSWLISTHMDAFLNTKYYKNLPTYLKKDVDLLHEADLSAH